MKNFNGGKI